MCAGERFWKRTWHLFIHLLFDESAPKLPNKTNGTTLLTTAHTVTSTSSEMNAEIGNLLVDIVLASGGDESSMNT